MPSLNLVIASDHAGFALKKIVLEKLKEEGYRVTDLGAFDETPSDYPDFARKIAQALQSSQADRGLLICGSGVGASVAVNKFRSIRAALCHDTFSAHQGVEDDDANVLCMGARIVGAALAWDIVKTFLSARFSQLPRHARRVNKIIQIENENR